MKTNTSKRVNFIPILGRVARRLALFATVALPLAASAADVLDDFESYAPGSNLHGQGPWEGWANNPAAGALVSTAQAFSPTRSVAISGASDLVRRFTDATGGVWVFSIRQFIPSTSTGTTYFILMNRYRVPYGAEDLRWSVQIQQNMATGMVTSDLGTNTLPMVKDVWIELRLEINLNNNTVSEYYNGQILSTHAWQDGTGDSVVAAFDLFANEAGPVYYDDLRLQELQPPTITQAPQSQTANVGGSASFTVAATGPAPLNFQWYFNGGAISNATGTNLTISPVTLAHAGTYAAVVWNASGSVTSAPAQLTVLSCITPPPGMVAWWPGDNNAGDIQGANHGTLMNGATLTPNGEVGPAFSLDGVNDYVRIPTSPSLNPTGSFTIDAWVYVTADVIGDIAIKWGDSGPWNGQRAYALHTIPGGGLNFAISDDANQFNGSFHLFTSPGGLIPLNTWKHVAGVYDQATGTRYIFVDGVQVASRTDPPVTITASIADLTIGGWLRSPTQEGYFFPGKIDEVEFFNRALSQQEIQAIFNAGSAGKCKPPCLTPLVLTCATNKTVQCGSAWSFDPPTATQPDCTNVTVSVLGTVTNTFGACSNVITRTWQATDCCSNIATCSQTVTIRDMTPPFITQQPGDTTAIVGEAIALELDATGAAPLVTRWYHSGQLKGEGSFLIITNLQPPSAGLYLATVSNALGMVTSQVAQVTAIAGTQPIGIELKVFREAGRTFLDVLVNRSVVDAWELQSRRALGAGPWITETNGLGSLRIELHPGAAGHLAKFYRARQLVPPSASDALRAVYSRLPREKFDTGLLLDIGGVMTVDIVSAADGTPIPIGNPLPPARIIDTTGFQDSYSHLRRSSFDGTPLLPDFNEVTVTAETNAQPQRLERHLAEQGIHAFAVAMVQYNIIDTTGFADGRLALLDPDENPIDLNNTNATELVAGFVIEGSNPEHYVGTARFVGAGLFQDVKFGNPGVETFILPTEFTVVQGQLEDISIRFPGYPVHYSEDGTNYTHEGFVAITPGQPFQWDFSEAPLGTNTSVAIPFVVRMVVNGQPYEAIGSFKYLAMSAPVPPHCSPIKRQCYYPRTRPSWWPLAAWNSRPSGPCDFYDGPKPEWWRQSITWAPPFGLYFTGGFPGLDFFGVRTWAVDPQVWGPLYNSATGAVGIGAPGGDNWACGFNARLYPAAHRANDPDRCHAENLIVVVDGFDLKDDRTQQSIWDDFGPNLQKMMDKGYDVLVLDYTHGRDYLQRNGYALLKVLRDIVPTYLKPQYAHHQVTVLAGSMGGQVARYALCKAEDLGFDHHTGLAIYLDSPFLGANIPWSIQGFVQFFAENQDIPNATAATELLDGLKSPAAQQLLRGWLNYLPSPLHDAFYSEANALRSGRGLPQNVRNVAVASGSAQGWSTLGSQFGAVNWNLSYARVATGQRAMGSNPFIGSTSYGVWGEIEIDAKAEGSSGSVLRAMTRGGLRVLPNKPASWTQTQKTEWTYQIPAGTRDIDGSPGGYRNSGADVIKGFNGSAPAGMNTMTSDTPRHNFIPYFSALYVRSADAGQPQAYTGKRTIYRRKNGLTMSGSGTFLTSGVRGQPNYWFGAEQSGATVNPAIKSLSPFDAIWYHYQNTEHVVAAGQRIGPGYEAFVFNEIDQFNSHERFASDSVLNTNPRRHGHEHFLFGDLRGTGQDVMLTINTFTREAMLQENTASGGMVVWALTPVWDSGLTHYIGAWPINKGDKYFLARIGPSGKKLLLSFSADTPGRAMVQEFDGVTRTWTVRWSDGGSGQIIPGCRVRPTNLYAFGDALGAAGDGSDAMLVAYPYVCNEVRESSAPGTSNLSDAWLVRWVGYGAGVTPVLVWNNSATPAALGGTAIRFGDHLEFGKIDPDIPDMLLSINQLRGVFGGWSVGQHWNAANGWNWTWSDTGTTPIGSWTLGNPRDMFHFADVDGDGWEELVCVNDTFMDIQEFHYTPSGTSLSVLCWCSPPNSWGIPTLAAHDRFYFGNVGLTPPGQSIFRVNPALTMVPAFYHWNGALVGAGGGTGGWTPYR